MARTEKDKERERGRENVTRENVNEIERGPGGENGKERK
jgi:hypothetical protein